MNMQMEWSTQDVNRRGQDAKLWLDGTDEQEDELDDVGKGILDAPTDDEGPGEIDESNKGDVALEEKVEGEQPSKPVDPNALKDFPGFQKP